MNHVARLLALNAFLVACGGTSTEHAGGTGGSAGAGGSGGSGGTGGAGGLAIPGSYDFVISKVTATAQSSGGPPSPLVRSPSEGQTMRLDVRNTSGSIEGILTPRWGMPAALVATALDGKYRFTGEVRVSASDPSVNASDTWTVLEIPSSGDALGTAVAMQGTETIVEGDVLWAFDLSGVATLEKDASPPELRSAPASPRGPADALLPWDAIPVDIAEPVASADFEAKTSVLLADVDHAGAPTPLPVVWRYTPTDDGTSWAGVVHAEAHLGGWDHHPAQTAKPYAVQAEAGIVDRSGLESAATSASFAVLDVGAPQPFFTLDASDAPAPVSWGLVTFHIGGAGVTQCEKGGCADIGPYNIISCGPGRHGVAGRVLAPTGTLDVRYRLLFASDAATPDAPPYPYGSAFTIEIAQAGSDATTRQVQAPERASLVDLGAGVGEIRWAAPWATETLALPGPLPPVVIDLGFSIGSAGAGTDWCGGGPLPPPVKTLLVVDSISGR